MLRISRERQTLGGWQNNPNPGQEIGYKNLPGCKLIGHIIGSIRISEERRCFLIRKIIQETSPRTE